MDQPTEPDASPPTIPTNSPASHSSNNNAASRLRIVAITFAMLGLVLGFVIAYYLRPSAHAVGWSDTPMDTVIDQQHANATELRSKIEALGKSAPGSPEAAKIQKELATILAAQDKLADRTHTEIKTLQDETTALRTAALKENRTVAGADFWLLPNESVTLRDRTSVFTLAGAYYNGAAIDVNLAGKVTRLKPGDSIELPAAGDSTCKVFYKVAHARQDGRYGFDLVVTPK